MRKTIAILIVSVTLLLTGVAHADGVVTIELVATPTPAPAATPTPLPELPDYEYPDEDARCLERGAWSVIPKYPTYETRLAFMEVVQNMVDDGRFRDTIRYTLLMDTEFPDYDPEAFRSDVNKEVADYAMRSWYHAKQTGDRSYRLTPASGVRFSFYRRGGKDYIVVYDWDWATVYDSGE